MAIAPEPGRPSGHPVETIAQLLDLTERRVQQLATEGVIPKARHGRYDVVGAVQGYVRYLRARQIQGEGAPTKVSDDVGIARARLVAAKARMADMEADAFQRRLLPREEVEKAWIAAVATMRSRMLAIPHATAQAVVHLESPAQIAAVLMVAVTEALDELTHTDVQHDDQGSDGTAGGNAAGGVPGSETAAEADALAMG